MMHAAGRRVQITEYKLQVKVGCKTQGAKFNIQNAGVLQILTYIPGVCLVASVHT
jgi:hypothetical protein